MARYRVIPTPLASATEIARALGELGLRDVEVHAEPEMLLDWIGRPSGVRAHVVVRRATLGSSSDDFGFARNECGTFDALLSEIHLFRFDRAWFAELARRAGVELPDAHRGTVRYASAQPQVGAPKPAPGIAASAVPTESRVERVASETEVLWTRFQKSQRVRRLGCFLFSLPFFVWGGLSLARARALDAGPFVFVWFAWAFVYFVGLGIALAARARWVARDFARRFPTGTEARAAAMHWLAARSGARDERARKLMQGFLAAIERESKADPGRKSPTQDAGRAPDRGTQRSS